MTRIYKTPFADTGDREPLAPTEQLDGKVSLPVGWTFDYEREASDPDYRPVGRQEMNGILYEVTDALSELQQYGFAIWQSITGGWPENARVIHDGHIYRSAAADNTTTPDASGSLWVLDEPEPIGDATESQKGIIQLATTPLAQGLTNDTRALTPKKLADAFRGGAQSLTGSGFQKLPGGLIMQWMYSTQEGATLNFPIAFPTACLGLYATYILDSLHSGSGYTNVYLVSRSQFRYYVGAVYTNDPVYIFAIGY